jgi:hypothetical protein
MAPLERFFVLEVEFHRKLRAAAAADDVDEAAALHTSYALQSGYEWLLRSMGPVTVEDIERLAARSALARDARDVLAARDSLIRLLGLGPFEM